MIRCSTEEGCQKAQRPEKVREVKSAQEKRLKGSRRQLLSRFRQEKMHLVSGAGAEREMMPAPVELDRVSLG